MFWRIWWGPAKQLPATRLGSDYGGWVVPVGLVGPHDVAICAGVGDDISFDCSLIAETDCRVVALDPTAASVDWLATQDLPGGFEHRSVGLTETDGRFTVSTDDYGGISVQLLAVEETEPGEFMQGLSYETIRRSILPSAVRLLKMDIEGSEYGVIRALADSPSLPKVLCVEFHHGLYGYRFCDTRLAVDRLRALGYEHYWVSDTGREFGFVLAGDD